MADHTLDDLREARENVEMAEAEVLELVQAARDLGYSWEKIAQALGVTRPAAWERYHQQVEK